MDANIIKIRIRKATGIDYLIQKYELTEHFYVFFIFKPEFATQFYIHFHANSTYSMKQVSDYIINSENIVSKNRHNLDFKILKQPLTGLEELLYG